MTEPPRPPGEGTPGSNDPSYSTPPSYDNMPPSSGAGAYPPPSSGAGAYPPPTSGAGAYPPPSSGAGAYPPPSSGAGAYPPPGGNPNAYPPPGGDPNAYPPAGGYGPPPGGGYQQPYGQPGYPGAKGNYVNDEKTWVILSHVGGIFIGFLAPLIIMLVKGNESQTVRAHAVEALNFQITWGVAMLVAVVLSVCTLGILSFLPFVVWIVVLIFGIMATIKVNDGEWYTYPVTYRIVK
ncbi:DUF4870 domain-containing protein [Catenuloplanes sp. NPDC051500]|uniref:DUF4870 domain-containing protein n=1 Tax=Catenuloplanes sp. NPDC051500 TaxID=3363959 RepID=UPI0037BAD70D